MHVKFHQEFIVKEDHLDDLNHVNNIQYIKWIQEISSNHWKKLTYNNIYPFGYWVVRSHHIEYKKQAKINDIVTAETYIISAIGYTSTRHVNFYINNSNKICVKAKTDWCYLSKKDFSLIKIPNEVSKLFNKL
ncbi:MAG: acyl-CoA thioesterase [Flavobacteriaceae bacterium]|nr:acyl-CoA thioesterase [Flavobacteriaceae bacterium]